MADILKELIDKLVDAYADRLVSVVLYGSGASGDHHKHFSDLNVLCVLKHVNVKELSEGEPIFHWWREHDNPSPLLMSEDEAHRSADSFPIEFRDMQRKRKILHGIDVIAHVEVDAKYYRAQLEHELRSKLFRLRQKGAGILSDPPALLRLCADSVSTFCVLGRHALLVAGVETDGNRVVIQQLGKKLNMNTRPFETLLDVRESEGAAHVRDPLSLFEQYLESIGKMVEFVDQLEK